MVNIVAVLCRLEEHEFFSNWAKIIDFQGEVSLAKLMPYLPRQKIAKMNCWSLAEKTGNCFRKFKIYKKSPKNDEEGGYFIKFEQGDLIDLITPKCVYDLTTGYISNLGNKWRERCESDIIALYAFMKGPACYKHIQETTSFLFPTSLENAHVLDCKRLFKFYYDTFSCDSPETWPYTCEQILNNVDRFFDLLSIEILRGKENIHNKKIGISTIIPKKGSDEYLYCEWYADWRQSTAHLPKHSSTDIKAISAFKKTCIRLSRNKDYPNSTYITWMRNYRKRKKM